MYYNADGIIPVDNFVYWDADTKISVYTLNYSSTDMISEDFYVCSA